MEEYTLTNRYEMKFHPGTIPPCFPSLRELRGAAISALLALLSAGRPVSRTWVERASGYSDKPVRLALNFLRERGLAGYTLAGWSLTRAGMQLPAYLEGSWKVPEAVFPEEKEPDPDSINNNRSLIELTEKLPALVENLPDLAEKLPDPVENLPDLPADPPSSVDHLRSQAGPTRQGKSPEEAAEIWRELALAGVQSNYRTEQLVHLPHVTAEYVRQNRIYFEHSRRKNKRWSGLLITTLEGGRPTPPVDEWEDRHGDDDRPVVAAQPKAGEAPTGEEPPAEAEAENGWDEAEGQEEAPGADPSVDLPATPEGECARLVWEKVAEQLRMEMPRAMFEDWVRPARLVGWDRAQGAFTLWLPSTYAREWLSSRMESRMERLLAGLCARSVKVWFVGPGEGRAGRGEKIGDKG